MRIIKFEAPWCGMCKAVNNVLKNITDIPVQFVNVDEEASESLVTKYKVKSLPTTIIVDDESNELKRYNGVMTLNALKEDIENLKK